MVAMLLSELRQLPPTLGVAVIVEFTHVALDDTLTTGNDLTVIVPVAVAEPQPSGVMTYMKVPVCVGFPLMVMVLES
jgi:hypothetical protein